LTLVANLIKLFGIIYGCIALSFDSGYVTRGINQAEKKFYEIATW
jgi:hypothetical protein